MPSPFPPKHDMGQSQTSPLVIHLWVLAIIKEYEPIQKLSGGQRDGSVIKCLLCKHEDLGLISSTHVKTLNAVGHSQSWHWGARAG